MKKFFLFGMIMLFFGSSIAQNVAINNDGQPAHSSAMLDVQNPNKGMLVPRVQLTGTNDVATIPSPAASLLVFNTATIGTGMTAVTPGFYYWGGNAWLRLNASADAWQVNGNSGTNSATNFLGTMDKASLVFKVNSLYAGTLDTLFNVFLGPDAGQLNKSFSSVAIGSGAFKTANGGEIVAIGVNSFSNNVNGIWNTAIGSYTLASHKFGNHNTAIGYAAMDGDTSGASNTAVGSFSLRSNKGGLNNNAFGSQVLFSNDSGSYNSAMGSGAMFSNYGGHQNSAYGRRALYNNISGNSNVAFGNWALHSNTNRSFLVAIGDSALFNNGINATVAYEATGNTAVGSKALQANTNGYSNSALGFHSLHSNTTGAFNTAIGSYSLSDNVTGGGNVAIGSDALHYNQAGAGNTAVGDGAAVSTNGNFNTALGQAALYSNQTGVNNTAVGHFALRNNELGFHNTGIGDFAGGTHTQNNNCTFLGSGSNSGSNGLNNATAVGFNAIVTTSNSVQLGNSNVTNVNTYGNLTVKNGKGIVRNTDGTQRKMVVTAVGVSPASIAAGGTYQLVFSFSESFSSAPEVYVGSVSGGGFAEVVMTLAEVSSTGAKLFVFNPRNFAVAPSFTVRIVAIGPE